MTKFHFNSVITAKRGCHLILRHINARIFKTNVFFDESIRNLGFLHTSKKPKTQIMYSFINICLYNSSNNFFFFFFFFLGGGGSLQIFSFFLLLLFSSSVSDDCGLYLQESYSEKSCAISPIFLIRHNHVIKSQFSITFNFLETPYQIKQLNMAEYKVKLQAYAKAILHAAKYPHCAVNGVLPCW